MEARCKTRGKRSPHENRRPHCSVARDIKLQYSQGNEEEQRRLEVDTSTCGTPKACPDFTLCTLGRDYR